MNHVPRAEQALIWAAIKATPPAKPTVWVLASHAHHFRKLEADGRQYFVQDPDNRNILHCTGRDGRYQRIDTSKLTIRVDSRRVKGAKAKRVQARIAGRDDLLGIRTGTPHAAPEICLIDLQRVKLICGFKKSFIYERENFPRPIRLGTARRSAVRWVEHEIVAWARAQVSARDQSDHNPTDAIRAASEHCETTNPN